MSKKKSLKKGKKQKQEKGSKKKAVDTLKIPDPASQVTDDLLLSFPSFCGCRPADWDRFLSQVTLCQNPWFPM
jgi:hypothetical protein